MILWQECGFDTDPNQDSDKLLQSITVLLLNIIRPTIVKTNSSLWFLFIQSFVIWTLGLPRWFSGKESTCQCRRYRFNPWVRKIPWRGKWQPTPVFLPGESHGQRSLVGYSSWGHRELNTTEATQHRCTHSRKKIKANADAC